jgi:hypothetical protein
LNRVIVRAAAEIGVVEFGQRVELHVGFDRAPLAVQFVELPRQRQGAVGVVGEQALDADRHVGEPPGGIDARADRETEIGGRAVRTLRPATWNSAAMPGAAWPLRMRSSPAATRMRLLRSSGTTSATVPSATRSSRRVQARLRRFDSGRGARSSARSASST